MALHSKDTVVKLDSDDLSAYTNSTTFNRSADSHEVTTYGTDSKVYNGGLKDGTVTIEGFYDTSATGPEAIIEPLLGTTVTFVFQVAGTGAGKPQKSCSVVVTSFNVSSPVADMVTWTAELQISGDVNEAAQV
jgi:hypothetical protein